MKGSYYMDGSSD